MGAKKIRNILVNEYIIPKKGFKILDLGCGTSEILRHLPNDIEYWGYDISQEYINAAENEFGNRGRFHCGLLTETDLVNLPKFDCILAIGVLHHLDDKDVDIFFSLANQALKSGGRVITIDPCLAEGQNPIARYLILKDRGQNVRSVQGYSDIAQRFFPTLKGTLRHRAWIPYTHWIMECTR